MQLHRSRATIHGNHLPVLDVTGGVAGSHHSRDAIFARDDRIMAARDLKGLYFETWVDIFSPFTYLQIIAIARFIHAANP